MLFAIEHRELTTTTTREYVEELSSEGNGAKASREPVLLCSVVATTTHHSMAMVEVVVAMAMALQSQALLLP